MSLNDKTNMPKALAFLSIDREVEAKRNKMSTMKRELSALKLKKEKLLADQVHERTLEQHVTVSHVKVDDFDDEEEESIATYEVTVPFSCKTTNSALRGGLVERDSLFPCIEDFKVERVLCTLDLIDDVDGIVELVGEYVKDRGFLYEFSQGKMFEVGTYKQTTPSFGVVEGELTIYVYVNEHHDENYIKFQNRGYDD